MDKDMSLYVDDGGYICFWSNKDMDTRGVWWTLHSRGWEAFFPGSDDPDFRTYDLIFPSDDDLGEVSEMFEKWLEEE